MARIPNESERRAFYNKVKEDLETKHQAGIEKFHNGKPAPNAEYFFVEGNAIDALWSELIDSLWYVYHIMEERNAASVSNPTQIAKTVPGRD